MGQGVACMSALCECISRGCLSHEGRWPLWPTEFRLILHEPWPPPRPWGRGVRTAGPSRVMEVPRVTPETLSQPPPPPQD